MICMHKRACLVFVLLLALACSDDSTGPDQPGATGPVTKQITPDGGTVTARGEEGIVYTLTFPAGAVRVPTRITLRPLSPSGNAWALAAHPIPAIASSTCRSRVDPLSRNSSSTRRQEG
jgi:hypothetical protein